LLSLAGEGKLVPRIRRRFPLHEAAAALDALIERQVIGKAAFVS
jgi:D-arabinose 1-dehydrogenase-like Zn-dependent alcohol dehydrogenase